MEASGEAVMHIRLMHSSMAPAPSITAQAAFCPQIATSDLPCLKLNTLLLLGTAVQPARAWLQTPLHQVTWQVPHLYTS